MISIKKYSIKLPTDLAAGGGAPRTRKIMTNIYTRIIEVHACVEY